MSPVCINIISIYVGVIGKNLESIKIWCMKLVKWVTFNNPKEQLKFNLGWLPTTSRPQEDHVNKAKLGFPRSRKGRKS